ncbi:MAG: glycerophosphodiester phosphodiesterase [Betaproteobacteria bacterium]|nr:glycerophosphodiester phosphodiesterase [Betaproteobacteria bacterium]
MRGLVALVGAPGAMSVVGFDLQGHRGARGLAPENTLPAFAAALSLGVSTLELDVGVSADGVVVIAHDRRLNPDITRDAAGNWLAHPSPTIRSLSFAQLLGYDVGRIRPGVDYARRYPEQKGADGVRMPRLADLFALVDKSGNQAVRFNIETKLSPLAPEETLDPEAFAAALIEVVRVARMAARVTVQSFDWRSLRAVQKLAPAIATSCLTAQQRWQDNIGAGNPAASPWVAGFQLQDHGSVPRMVRAAGCGTWSPFFGEIDKATVAEAQALGLKVLPWTVNEPAHLRAVLDLGVDGLITDRPDLARAALAERGMALPAPVAVQP